MSALVELDASDRPAWIAELVETLGAPKVCVEKPEKLGNAYRRLWVWFIDGRNHNIRIDWYPAGSGRWEVAIGCPGSELQLRLKEAPDDDRCRAALKVAGWPSGGES